MDKSFDKAMERYRQILKEAEELSASSNKQGADNGVVDGTIPYTMQDEMMSSITDTCKQQFGADFSNMKNPMLYYIKDGDITLSGEIPTMNNAKFQFRYKDSSGNGCYLWTSPIQLTDESIRTLSVMNGVFKNWKKDLSTSEDIKPMTYKSQENLSESFSREPLYRRGDDIL